MPNSLRFAIFAEFVPKIAFTVDRAFAVRELIFTLKKGFGVAVKTGPGMLSMESDALFHASIVPTSTL